MQNIGIISTHEHRHISEIEIDETCVIELLLLDAIEKRDKNDRPFVTMKVTDGERRVSMRQFGHGIGDVEPLVGGMVRAVVRCTEYNGAPSYAVIAMQKGDDSKRDEYVESSPIQPQRMYDELTDGFRKLADEAGRSIGAKGHVARMTLRMLDGNKDAFMTHGAASSVHHAYKGGLLYHSYRMFKLARMVASLYDVDDEILACAARLYRLTAAEAPAECENDGLLRTLWSAMVQLRDGAMPAAVEFRYMWRLLAAMGTAPSLEYCAGCGERLARGGLFTDEGILCGRCAARAKGAPLSERELLVLRAAAALPHAKFVEWAAKRPAEEIFAANIKKLSSYFRNLL